MQAALLQGGTCCTSADMVPLLWAQGKLPYGHGVVRAPPPRSLSLVAYIENTVKQWISRPELIPRRLEPQTLVLLDVCSDQLNYETR